MIKMKMIDKKEIEIKLVNYVAILQVDYVFSVVFLKYAQIINRLG